MGPFLVDLLAGERKKLCSHVNTTCSPTVFMLLCLSDVRNKLLLISLVASIMGDKPTVKELLSRSPADVVSFLGGIYEHSQWVADDLSKQSSEALTKYESITDLAAAMKKIVDGASKEKKLQPLCAHPDLCEKVGKLEQLTKESQEEQSRSGLQSCWPFSYGHCLRSTSPCVI